ncbi:MAG: Ig-like domain-containing protein, partial [Propionibacteriaceae bacterium]|nr:Ig-like domain-containing protein [Propionibacteriaceae bacterium]
MAVAGLSGTGLLLGSSPSQATEPGKPGVPQPGTVVYSEDFQNTSTTPISLTSYSGLNGTKYTADAGWLPPANECDGWVMNAKSTQPSVSVDSGCNGWPWTLSQELAGVLSQGQGLPATNNVLSANTSQPGTAQVAGYMLKMTSNVPATVGHFYAVSAWFAAAYCNSAHPSITLSLVANTTEYKLSTGLDPCTAPAVAHYTINDSGGKPMDAYVIRFQSAPVQITTANVVLGMNLYNATNNGSGNDMVFDTPSIVDVTPQLDVQFGSTLVNGTTPTSIVFTITNTDDLLAKNGWSFGANIPSGLTLAPDAQVETTCPNTAPSLTGSVLSVTGDIAATMNSCTVTVPVVSDTQAGSTGNYAFTLDDMTGLYAIASPGVAELTVDAQPPDPPVISGPADGLVTADARPEISGTAEPDSHVVVKAGNVTICSTDADDDGNWSCTPAADLDDGTYTITATATDAVGNQSDPSDQVRFTVDTGAPDPPQITWPTNNGRAGAT